MGLPKREHSNRRIWQPLLNALLTVNALFLIRRSIIRKSTYDHVFLHIRLVLHPQQSKPYPTTHPQLGDIPLLLVNNLTIFNRVFFSVISFSFAIWQYLSVSYNASTKHHKTVDLQWFYDVCVTNVLSVQYSIAVLPAFYGYRPGFRYLWTHAP